MCTVENRSMYGVFKENPFHFKHNNLETLIRLDIDFLNVCCFLHWIQSVNLHFLLPYIIMDLPIFAIAKWATLLVDIHCPRGGS